MSKLVGCPKCGTLARPHGESSTYNLIRCPHCRTIDGHLWHPDPRAQEGSV